MAKEWTDEEVQAQIADAVRIVREDKFEAFIRSKIPRNENPEGDKNPPASGGNNNDPNAGGTTTTKRKSLWWGEES